MAGTRAVPATGSRRRVVRLLRSGHKPPAIVSTGCIVSRRAPAAREFPIARRRLAVAPPISSHTRPAIDFAAGSPENWGFTINSAVACPLVQPADQRRAREAAMATAAVLGLAVDDAVVLNDSNRLVVRLIPCDVVARIVPRGYRVFSEALGADREVQVLRRLVDADAPVAALEPRVDPRVFVRDGFEIELLTYYEPLPARALPAEDYANALERLHASMRKVDVETPHFTDRVADVEEWVARRGATPDLSDENRELLVHTLTSLRTSVVERSAPEQLLHGEPHPWNVLDTTSGLRFVDFENCVRGPVEWDLGWVPSGVSERYSGADRELVVDCRGLALAVVAAHGWRPEDERPGRESAVRFLNAVREGPPWRALDDVGR